MDDFKNRRVCLAAAWSALIVLGCTETAPSGYDAIVQGTVTIDGELAPGGTVSFEPKGDGPVAVGAIASDGSYAVRIGQGNATNPDSSKIPSGDYVATVVVNGPPGAPAAGSEGGPLAVGPRLMADKYASTATSELKFEIAKGLNVIDLKLDGAWANPPQEEADNGDADKDEADKPEDQSDETSTEVNEEAPTEQQAGEPATTDAAPSDAPSAEGSATESSDPTTEEQQ